MDSYFWYALFSLPYYSHIYCLPSLFFWNKRDILFYSVAFFLNKLKQVTICEDWLGLDFFLIGKTIL